MFLQHQIALIKELKINYTESIHPIYKLISLDKTINIKDSFLKLKKEYNCNLQFQFQNQRYYI